MAEFFHVLSRGVDKRKIFLDNQDYFRFIHDLFEFNNEDRVNTTFYLFNKSNDIASRKIIANGTKDERKPRKLLVDIHAFCIMPNHYHLLLSSRKEHGISRFMKKVNMGYAKYFNEKYDRKGTLFEGRYKSIAVTAEAHLLHLPYYIHLNPLDLVAPEWRARTLHNSGEAMKFLESYRWSSHLDYMGKKNFPSVTNREFLTKFFGETGSYKRDLIAWLKTIGVESVQEVFLEK